MAFESTERVGLSSEPGETGREGVKMVAAWILLVVVFFVLTRGGPGRRR
ncbi:hypothetical protein [Haladaptatus sp. DYF46]|nr:hypothetical protein [Haladaptatus sp. DYF46]